MFFKKWQKFFKPSADVEKWCDEDTTRHLRFFEKKNYEILKKKSQPLFEDFLPQVEDIKLPICCTIPYETWNFRFFLFTSNIVRVQYALPYLCFPTRPQQVTIFFLSVNKNVSFLNSLMWDCTNLNIKIFSSTHLFCHAEVISSSWIFFLVSPLLSF